jgi:hypothetical protein
VGENHQNSINDLYGLQKPNSKYLSSKKQKQILFSTVDHNDQESTKYKKQSKQIRSLDPLLSKVGGSGSKHEIPGLIMRLDEKRTKMQNKNQALIAGN